MKTNKKRFKVISVHYTTECDLNCPFCYKTRSNKVEEKYLLKNLSNVKFLEEYGDRETITQEEFERSRGRP